MTRVRLHLVALMRLVEICVDGQARSDHVRGAGQLADAYLEVGRGLEARIISEDLVAREPWNRANIERFRKSLVMLGEADPDATIADRLSGDSPFMAADFLDLNEGMDFSSPIDDLAAAGDSEPSGKGDPGKKRGKSSDGNGAAAASAESVVNAVATSEAAPAPRTRATAVRDEADRASNDEEAAEQYRLALTYQDMGMIDDAVSALESRRRSPRQRFDAASMLGRLHLEQQQTTKAVEWFERAAEAPAPTPDAGRALLYNLASTLESAGENSRALAVLSNSRRNRAATVTCRPASINCEGSGKRLVSVPTAPADCPAARNRAAAGTGPVVHVLGTELLR